LPSSHGIQAFRYKAMMDMIATGKLKPQRLVIITW
jgi:alcohol dehydrogenase